MRARRTCAHGARELTAVTQDSELKTQNFIDAMSLLLEVIVQTVADARAAEDGGADRLEVVRDIDRDGLTPSLDVVRAIALERHLPLRIMVRDRDDFSAGDSQALKALQRAIASFAALGVDGAVVGFARDAAVDLDTTAAVLSAAPALSVTFHRAFDVARDPAEAFEALRRLIQVDRVLTTGGSGDWALRCERLRQYAVFAGEHLTIIAGGGLDAAGLQFLKSTGCVREAHVGRAAREPQVSTAPVSADRVRRLKAIVSARMDIPDPPMPDS
jgi:copper homeostasis protein